MNTKLIVSRYSEDVSWLKNYDIDHIIYNKGEKIDGEYNVLDVPNIGNNQRDIFEFIHDNYDDLPEIMIFVQGNPYDHCGGSVEKFNEFIKNKTLTSIEHHPTFTPDNVNTMLSETGGYTERNNSWYVSAHNGTYNQTCIWSTFDDFMNKTFVNYEQQYWCRFAPGSQYIITKDIARHYSKTFWKYLMDILHKNNMTEGHIIERSLWMVFNCYLEPINELK